MKRPGNKAWLGWLLQRLTAVYLTVFLCLHLLHAATTPSAGVESIVGLVQTSWLWWFAYVKFVPCVVFHGFYGVYSVFLDYQPPEAIARVSKLVLWLLGVLTVVLGWWTLVKV